MPDTATLASPPPNPALSSGATGDPVSDKILGVESQNIATARRQLGETQKKEEAAIGAAEKSVEGLHPPTFTPPPMPQVHQTSPQQAWGSAAMLFALVASAFTRNHLTTAINAAAGALEAFRKGDIENANAAFKQWKILSDQSLQQATFEMDRYRAIMGDATRREDIAEKLGSQEQKTILAELQTTGQALGDQLMAHVQSLHEANQLQIERMRLREQMALSGQKIEENFMFEQEMAKWRKEHPDATPEDALVHAGEIRQKLGHQWDDQQINAAIQNSNTRAAAYGKASGYTGAAANVSGILEFDMSKPPDNGEVVRQGQALDKFIQTINGNRAIRGFQLQLLQRDAGLYNRFQHAMQQLGTGGPVTRDVIATMQTLARDYMHVTTLNYGDYITGEQWQHHKVGLDPTYFVPPDYHPEQDPERKQYPAPPPAAVSYLKAHDTKDAWVSFDELFGQGAAASAFSGGE